MRLVYCLLKYNFKVEHFTGMSNRVADMLSIYFSANDKEVPDDIGDTARLLTMFGNSQLAVVTSK